MYTIEKLQDLRDFVKETVADRTGKQDPRGDLTAAMVRNMRQLAIAAFLVDNDVAGFRKSLKEAAELQLSLFERAGSGDDIFKLHISLSRYRVMFDALAACEFKLAVELANHFEHRSTSDFENSIGTVLKYCILGDTGRAPGALHELANALNQSAEENGYYVCLAAISTGRGVNLGEKLKRLEETHRLESSAKYGLFVDTAEELLSLWGIGLANLGVFNGDSSLLSYSTKLIPQDLLYSEET